MEAVEFGQNLLDPLISPRARTPARDPETVSLSKAEAQPRSRSTARITPDERTICASA